MKDLSVLVFLMGPPNGQRYAGSVRSIHGHMISILLVVEPVRTSATDVEVGGLGATE